mmetsp:Transcript_3346/g.7728  ORF Transcript_3346/g.7728 Transcript_3346/m.7728 type:complete len:217 (+) Transcript_3346:263-913(+)
MLHQELHELQQGRGSTCVWPYSQVPDRAQARVRRGREREPCDTAVFSVPADEGRSNGEPRRAPPRAWGVSGHGHRHPRHRPGHGQGVADGPRRSLQGPAVSEDLAQQDRGRRGRRAGGGPAAGRVGGETRVSRALAQPHRAAGLPGPRGLAGGAEPAQPGRREPEPRGLQARLQPDRLGGAHQPCPGAPLQRLPPAAPRLLLPDRLLGVRGPRRCP